MFLINPLFWRGFSPSTEVSEKWNYGEKNVSVGSGHTLWVTMGSSSFLLPCKIHGQSWDICVYFSALPSLKADPRGLWDAGGVNVLGLLFPLDHELPLLVCLIRRKSGCLTRVHLNPLSSLLHDNFSLSEISLMRVLGRKPGRLTLPISHLARYEQLPHLHLPAGCS